MIRYFIAVLIAYAFGAMGGFTVARSTQAPPPKPDYQKVGVAMVSLYVGLTSPPSAGGLGQPVGYEEFIEQSPDQKSFHIRADYSDGSSQDWRVTNGPNGAELKPLTQRTKPQVS